MFVPPGEKQLRVSDPKRLRRVDHKSVSRRHTGIYYTLNTHVVIIQDLGGKHGTIVNNQRLEKLGKIELPLETKEHVIRFGNAPVLCQLVIPEIQPKQPQMQPQNNITLSEEEKDQPQIIFSIFVLASDSPNSTPCSVLTQPKMRASCV